MNRRLIINLVLGLSLLLLPTAIPATASSSQPAPLAADTSVFTQLPDYDSGWTTIAQATAKTFTHNLGGNTDNYVVDVQAYDADGRGINHQQYGGDWVYILNPLTYYGYYWRELSTSQITVWRYDNDLRADSVRVRIWVVPSADYDSGWTTLAAGSGIYFTHNLGGNTDGYVVDLQFKETTQSFAVNGRKYGCDTYYQNGTTLREEGSCWGGLTNTEVWVRRGAADANADQVRLRLWRAPTPSYDSGWTAIGLGTTLTFNHNLGGDAEDYVVDMQFQDSSGIGAGVNQWGYGLNTDYVGSAYTYSGAFWHSLTASSIQVYRGANDYTVDSVRVRLWVPSGKTIYLPLVVGGSPLVPRIPNDPDFAGNWKFDKVQATSAWGLSTGNGVVIAIVDSGVDVSHPDLQGKFWANAVDGSPGWNFIDNNNNPYDDQGHGTTMALVAAAKTNNGYANAALGWDTKIMALKVGDSVSIKSQYLDNAVQYAIDHGANVINMSMNNAGSCTAWPELQTAIDNAYNAGILVVASAPNSTMPANCTHVLGVSASGTNDTVISPATGNASIDVAAPGDTTSEAAAWVSGLASLIKARYPAYTAFQMGTAILCNADDIGAAGLDMLAGWGRINAYRAVLNGAGGCAAGY